MFSRRKILSVAALSAATIAAGYASPVFAQSDTTRVYVGFPAGGGLDVIARVLGEQLKVQLPGQNVLIENKAGGAGRIAVDTLKRSAADGTSLLVTPAPVITLLPHTSKVSYDPLRDVTPIARLATFDYALAVAVNTKVTSLAQYIEAVKKDPGMATFGSPGAGLSPHFVGLMLARKAGIDLVHAGYKGTAPALQDLVGGHVPAVIATSPALVEGHKNGRFRVLAVSGPKRSPYLPDVPTFAELGYKELVIEDWAGVFAPGNLSPEMTKKLNAAVNAALADEKLQGLYKKAGFIPAPVSAAQAKRLTQEGYESWKRIVSSVGFKAVD